MSLRILVVDDSQIVTKVVAMTLSSAGYEVDTVNSPLLATSKMIEFKPDIVLLDLNMPGLKGEKIIELAARRKYGFNYSIVIHSSEDEARMREAADIPGVIGYIKKGKPDDSFLSAVKGFCAKHESAYGTCVG